MLLPLLLLLEEAEPLVFPGETAASGRVPGVAAATVTTPASVLEDAQESMAAIIDQPRSGTAMTDQVDAVAQDDSVSVIIRKP